MGATLVSPGSTDQVMILIEVAAPTDQVMILLAMIKL